MKVWQIRLLLMAEIFLTSTVHAQGLKKVLILDVVNIDKNSNYDYLVGSITEALTAKLKENFAFRDTPKDAWQKAAQNNDLLFEDESYTRTFAMTLGIRMRQDIAISGGFRVAVVKGQQVMKATLFLIDVPNRRIIDTVEKNMPLTGDLFSKVDELARDLTKAAEKVLPGKDYYAKHQDEFAVTQSSLSLVTSAFFLTANGPKSLDEDSLYLTPSRFKMMYAAGLQYQTNLWRRLDFWGQALAYFSNANVTSQQQTNVMPSTLFGGSGIVGLAWVFDIGKKYHITPRAGGGYMYGQAKLDFSQYSKPPRDANNKDVLSTSLMFYGPVVVVGADFSWDVSQTFFLNLGTVAQMFFNGVGSSTTMGVTLGGGYRF